MKRDRYGSAYAPGHYEPQVRLPAYCEWRSNGGHFIIFDELHQEPYRSERWARAQTSLTSRQQRRQGARYQKKDAQRGAQRMQRDYDVEMW